MRHQKAHHPTYSWHRLELERASAMRRSTCVGTLSGSGAKSSPTSLSRTRRSTARARVEGVLVLVAAAVVRNRLVHHRRHLQRVREGSGKAPRA